MRWIMLKGRKTRKWIKSALSSVEIEGCEGSRSPILFRRSFSSPLLSASLLHILAYPVLGFLVSQPLLAMAQARETARVIVPGTDPSWTRIAVVPTNTVVQVRAMGTVKFGILSTTDTASAGVESNPFLQRLKMLLRGQAEEQIGSEAKDPTMEDFRRTSRQVNFSQGGVWIRIVSLGEHNELMPPNLYYYWEKFYNDAHLKFPVPIEVYAKVHDGGKLAEGCHSAYADNVGSYTVWLDLLMDRKQGTRRQARRVCKR
jgi:hypothetical protein